MKQVTLQFFKSVLVALLQIKIGVQKISSCVVGGDKVQKGVGAKTRRGVGKNHGVSDFGHGLLLLFETPKGILFDKDIPLN